MVPGEGEIDDLWRGFFEGLSTDGRVMVVGPMLEHPPSRGLLQSWEAERRGSWPEDLPEFDPAAAEWGCSVISLGAICFTSEGSLVIEDRDTIEVMSVSSRAAIAESRRRLPLRNKPEGVTRVMFSTERRGEFAMVIRDRVVLCKLSEKRGR